MKRYLVLLGLILIVAVSVWAHDAVLKINPSDMKDGEKKVLEEDGRTITLEKKGRTMIVNIDGAGDTQTLTITRDGDHLRIDRDGERGHMYMFGPDHRKLIIDGMELGQLPQMHALHPRMDTWYVCPKDKTMVRIPESKADDDATYKCPVDGTTLEKRKGRGFMFMFDDTVIDL